MNRIQELLAELYNCKTQLVIAYRTQRQGNIQLLRDTIRSIKQELREIGFTIERE